MSVTHPAEIQRSHVHLVGTDQAVEVHHQAIVFVLTCTIVRLGS